VHVYCDRAPAHKEDLLLRKHATLDAREDAPAREHAIDDVKAAVLVHALATDGKTIESGDSYISEHLVDDPQYCFWPCRLHLHDPGLLEHLGVVVERELLCLELPLIIELTPSACPSLYYLQKRRSVQESGKQNKVSTIYTVTHTHTLTGTRTHKHTHSIHTHTFTHVSI